LLWSWVPWDIDKGENRYDTLNVKEIVWVGSTHFTKIEWGIKENDVKGRCIWYTVVERWTKWWLHCDVHCHTQ